MNALRILLLGILLISLPANALILPQDLDKYLEGAKIVAHVEVVSNVPEKIYTNFDFACGSVVTARVIESFKGSETGRTITFGSTGLKVGAQYVVALYVAEGFGGDTKVLIVPEDMSDEEAERKDRECFGRLPSLKDSWTFTSEFVGQRWVSWGFRVRSPANDTTLTFIRRTAPDVIQTFTGVGAESKVASSESVSADHPEYGQIVASTFVVPLSYVEWAAYRSLLLKSIE
jgi:hypothetical protein